MVQRAGITVLIVVVTLLVVVGMTRRFWTGIAPAVLPPAPLVDDAREPDGDQLLEGTNTTGLPLTLSPGLSIGVFASKLGPVRDLVRDPLGVLLASVPKDGRVVALPDADGDGHADATQTVIEGLNRPHGIAFAGDGSLVIAETQAVAKYDYDRVARRASNRRVLMELPAGENHWTRSIVIVPGMTGREDILVSVGSTCNVCIERDARRAAVSLVGVDGSGARQFATGLRNAVFLALHPKTGAVWVTEMGRDWLGDDLPPDEVNVLLNGADYGWPYCYGANTQDPFGRERGVACDTKTPSTIALPAHVAPLGLTFVPDDGWPEEWRGDLIIAYHGSWNRSEPAGYEVHRFNLGTDSSEIADAGSFISGWAQGGRASGRPVDILMLPGGTAYLSDDKAEVVYRLTYQE